ncbi:BMP family protein [Pseudovibrio ascidiaceicola]|uniref:BMP family protein n=1 Tax=Pseudovibrio ascidiaceicola TaxID=285279 RepID=UPI003D36A9D6
MFATRLNGLVRRHVLAAVAAFAAIIAVYSPAKVLAAEPLKVAAIYTVPVEQQWVGRIHQALNAAAERGDITYVYSENTANTDYERVMREYAEAGHQLIVGEAFAVERAARNVAAEYPETAFLMGSSFPAAEPNFAVFDNFIHEPSYLSGMIAGAKSKSGKIGMIGGFAIPEVNRLMHAFMNGAKATNPDVTFTVNFINSWYDPPKAKETAYAMIDAGADVLYAERFGVSDAAMEKSIFAIGNVIDTAADYPNTILASAIWHMEPTVDTAIAAVKANNFKAEDYGKFSFMGHGGGSLVVDETLVDADLLGKVKAVEASILDGSFIVEINDEEPKSSN